MSGGRPDSRAEQPDEVGAGLTDKCLVRDPFFSICVPQYNRTSFLLHALASYHHQTFRRFEICISDGHSTDGREAEVIEFLERAQMPYRYMRHEQKTPYDANLRSAIGLAAGKYCFLLGNDDALAAEETLADVAAQLEAHAWPEVAISNYLELSTNRRFSRVHRNGLLGAGPLAAAANFRNFSFVSGILIARSEAQRLATERWDGSEMYQMYIGCRTIAEGGRLLGLTDTVIHKDIQVPGESVDSYARRPRIVRCPIVERKLPLADFGRVACDAITTSLPARERESIIRKVFSQVLTFTYPPWLIEYRKVQSWKYAAGVALGMRPRNILRGLHVGYVIRAWLCLLYACVTTTGLLLPLRLFDRMRPWLYARAKAQPSSQMPEAKV